MELLEQSVFDIIDNHNLVSSKDTILVAVSGGPDSTALLSLLTKLVPASVNAAVYVNHNLRPQETEAEIDHVKRLCGSLDVDFEYCSVDVNRVRLSSGESPEACARRLRFESLDELARTRGTNLLALGHTKDDQVEEVLIRLIRGSGMNGLSGMRLKNKHIIRPLLENSKQEILDYLGSQNLSFCSDSSNKSRTYLRNRVRLDLIPLLESQFNPSIKQNILNSTIILRDEDIYLDEIASNHYKLIVDEVTEQLANQHEQSFKLSNFIILPPSIQRRILEKMFWSADCPPTFQAIEEILELAESGRTGTNFHFSGGLRVIRTASTIIFSSRPIDKSKRLRTDDVFAEQINIEAPGQYTVTALGKTLYILECDQFDRQRNDVLYLDARTSVFPCTLRAPAPGETFHPIGAPGRKKVSRFFSDKKLPRHLRHRFPVLVSSDNTIIAIPGITISDSVKISEKNQRCLEVFWK